MMSLIDHLALMDIRLKHYGPQEGTHIVCPKCNGGKDKSKDLSVTITPDGGAVWICHRKTCDWTGNIPGSDRRNRVEQLPKKHIRPVKQVPASCHQTVMDWLFTERRISAETAASLSVTGVLRFVDGAEQPCLALPYFKQGELVNNKYRAIGKKAFAQEKGAERTIFNVDSLADNDTAIFVEGEMDVLALYECGFPNGVTLPDGAGNYQAFVNCYNLIEHIDKWILAGDNDAPGKEHTEELARRVGRDKIWLVTWPNGLKDANDTLKQLGPDAVREAIANARPHPVKSLFAAGQFIDDVLALYSIGRSKGVSTGWKALDPFLTVRPGELSIVTGIPGSGKSQFIDSICINIARKFGWKFAVCSFENPPDEHLAKLSEQYVGMPFWDGPTRRMSERQLESAINWLDKHFLFIRAEDEAPTFDWIMEKAKAAVLKFGVKGVIVDPYNEIEHKRPPGMTETEYVSNILSVLKRFCQNHGVHAWFIAHPAKMRRDEKGQIPVPSLYDISGSANWVNKADVGIVVARNYEEGSREVDVHIKKVRFKATGEPGIATLVYDKATGTYSDPSYKDESDHHNASYYWEKRD